MSNQPEVLWDATFNPRVRTYWLLSGAIILTVTIFGILLLPVWFLLGNYFTGRYLERMRCTLTTRSLMVGKGFFVRVEKTVPLDKITDVGLVHGPIMRHLGLQAISVETAGQSSQGALIRMVGIKDTTAFREAVLEQRDKVVASVAEPGGAALPSPATDAGSAALLTEIRDSLLRIEDKLGNSTGEGA